VKGKDGSFSDSKLNFPGLSSSSFGLNLKDYYLLRDLSALSLSLLLAFSHLTLSLKGYELAKDDSLHGNIPEGN